MYCIYLRKSRADAEAEAHGEGETLARHERILLELSKARRYAIGKIYREIVSGESIAARPEMQQLLLDVESGLWEGVLVMEVERLARGDTIDQGLVAQAFKYSDTKIITPLKVYDPNNEFDEEYFEFGLFMSRREYKTINRRLQQGRIAAVKEGKYCGNKTPYGYERVKIENDKGFTLKIIEDEAEIIRLMYDWYTNGDVQPDGSVRRLGPRLIAKKLNTLGIKPKERELWSDITIRGMLDNPVYCGLVRWNWRKTQKKVVDGKVQYSRPKAKLEDCVLIKGLHPAIISEELFYKTYNLLHNNPPRPIGGNSIVKNPISSLIVCGKCGKHLVRRPYSSNQEDTLMCPDPDCKNVSSKLSVVEARLLSGLKEWLDGYRLEWAEEKPEKISNESTLKKALSKLDNDIFKLRKQLSTAYDMLEQGVYSTEIFLERSQILNSKIIELKHKQEEILAQVQADTSRVEATQIIIPKVERLLDVYNSLPDAASKNDMLKEVVECAYYTKNERSPKRGPFDNFELIVVPKLPKQLA